ncbi:MAG: gliding motility lipoprotein GldH [Paludibacteraceae bacterium]|nr:gliding motility lipoprotein GldH [Paludibacteraceae bacterium]
MTKRIVHILLCVVFPLVLLLTGCQRDVVSSAHHDLPEQGWSMTDTVRLSLDVNDTVQAYDIALTLRHTDRYTYQNLWLFVQGDSLSPVQTDTVMACLADDRGRWLGTRAGRYYSGYVTICRGVLFPQAGSCAFTIVQGMRDSVIYGIADVGLELRKAKAYGEE